MKSFALLLATTTLLAVSNCSEIDTLENAAKRNNETLTEKNLYLVNNDNYLELLQKQAYATAKDKIKPLFMLFATRDNEDIWKYSKDWIQLSTIAHKQYTIARTDCNFDHEVCKKFEIQSYPFVLFFKNNMIFKYKGGLDIETLLKYLSADNFKAEEFATVYNENFAEYVAQIDGSFNLMTRLVRWSDDITLWANDKSFQMFKKINLHHWSGQSKLIVFIMTALGFPAVVITWLTIYGVIWSKRELTESFCPKKRHIQQQNQVQQQQQAPAKPKEAPNKTGKNGKAKKD